MATGERIRFIRNLRGMTQKWLGTAVGFDEKAADVRMAQYESGVRTPKENLLNDIAKVLEVAPEALDVPNIESYIGLMHTLFALEDIYGLTIDESDGEICIKLNKENPYLHYNLACAYIKLAELKKAKNELIKAVTIKNDIPEIHYNLAYVYKCLNKPEIAKTYLDNYNKLVPTNY